MQINYNWEGSWVTPFVQLVYNVQINYNYKRPQVTQAPWHVLQLPTLTDLLYNVW
jgi:hypothetical protein